MTLPHACRSLNLMKAAFIVLVFLAATGVTSFAQIFSTLINFDGTDGAQPV